VSLNDFKTNQLSCFIQSRQGVTSVFRDILGMCLNRAIVDRLRKTRLHICIVKCECLHVAIDLGFFVDGEVCLLHLRGRKLLLASADDVTLAASGNRFSFTMDDEGVLYEMLNGRPIEVQKLGFCSLTLVLYE